MRKIFTIAAREYQAAVRTKAFLLTLVILPVLMGGAFIAQALTSKFEEQQEERIAVIDRTPGQQLYPVLEKAAARLRKEAPAKATAGDNALGEKRTSARYFLELVEPSMDTPDDVREQRHQLSARVRKGELYGFLDIGSAVTADAPPPALGKKPADQSSLRYLAKAPAFDAFPDWAERVVNEELSTKRLGKLKLPPKTVQEILRPFPVLARALAKDENAEEESTTGQIANIFVPLLLMMLMFMMVMFGASPLMQGVLEEKSQRIAEVLLGSVRPFDLMLGKLLGMIGVSLTVLSVYLGAAYWVAYQRGYAQYVPVEVLGWVVVFQVLAVLLFGSVFISIGAACSDSKEMQTMMLPVSLVICLPLFVLRSVLRDPNSGWLTAVSFFPPWTSMLMVARMTVPPGIPLWQPILGVVVMLAATLAGVYVAGRIFRVGMLMQGKGARLSEIVRWVLHG